MTLQPLTETQVAMMVHTAEIDRLGHCSIKAGRAFESFVRSARRAYATILRAAPRERRRAYWRARMTGTLPGDALQATVKRNHWWWFWRQ